MAPITRIHKDKQPVRIHFIKEWAARRNLRQADLVRELLVDKSTVSRWFKGSLPTEEHLVRLAGLMGTEVSGLFRHPDDDWIARLLKGRSDDERTRILQVIELSFPRRTGTDG